MLRTTAVALTFCLASAGVALAQSQASTADTRKADELVGCVSADPGASGSFTFSETTGSQYRLTGKSVRKYAGKMVYLMSGPQKKLRMSVPMSPIPVTKKAPTVARTVVERRPAPTRNRAMLWASLSVIGVLALGGGGYAVLQMGKPTSLTGVEQQSQAATPPAGAPQPLAAPVDSVPAVGTPGTDPAVARADSIARARAAAARRDSIRITRAAEQRLSRPAATKTAPPVAGRPDGARARGLSTLRLILSPPATVFIDGQSKGQQSRVVDELLPGLHTLRIEREGWIAKDTTVTLTAGQISTIRIQLSERRP